METVERQVRQWLERVVIGLNLCPFAATPYRNGQIRISVSQAATGEKLLEALQSELVLIDGTSPIALETTLLVVAGMLSDFDVYNQFLAEVDALMRQERWEGKYQVASFHPRYRFLGTDEDDASNLTNCSPWPILHILREASINRALTEYPEPENIPARNIQKIESLSPEQRRHYFPW